MTYRDLSQAELYQIYALMKSGLNQQEIAQILKRARSTISREVHRNAGLKGYRPQQAQTLSNKRSEGSRNARRVTEETLRIAAYFLLQELSPEQVTSVCRLDTKRFTFKSMPIKRKAAIFGKACVARRSIESGIPVAGIVVARFLTDRPVDVETRRGVGHWEGDTIIGVAHKNANIFVVERKSGCAVLSKLQNKTAAAVSQAIIDRLKPYAARVLTMTYDNGKEFTDHAWIDAELCATGYFADPFASWQRGSNENLNGLVRQYIPKKRLLYTVTDKELKMIEDKLNFRPRKRLGFKTPHQVFN